MRVLFPFVGDTIGGSHHSAALLMTELPRHGIEPLPLIHRPGPLADFLAGRGLAVAGPDDLPVWQAGGGPLSSLARLIRLTPRLWRELRRRRVDAVHVNDGRMAISWSLACRLAAVPLVVHQRTRFAPSRVSRLALAQAARVVAISDYTRQSVPAALRGRVGVVPNPFAAMDTDRARSRTELAAELAFDPARPILAFVGTLQRQKRPLVALEALVRLRDAGHPALLLMAGRADGDEAKAVRAAIAQWGLDDSVRLLGFRADVGRILAAADLLVAPAVNEGHGRAVVEAMLAATPVVAAASGGHGEAVADGRTGLLVPPDDASALARAMVSLLDDSARAVGLAEAARAEALRLFSLDAHATTMAALYRSLRGRIALVIEGMGGGGAQQVAARLLDHWAGRGDRPVLVTFLGPDADAVAVDGRIERRVVGGVGASRGAMDAIRANLRRLVGLRRALRDSGARLVVAFVTTTNILAILATLGLGVRVVVSERNDPARQPVGRAWDRLRRLTYPLAWRVTANSRAALDSLAAYVPREKLALVPNPLRPDSGAPAAAAEAPFVLAVGRLHPQKDYPVLLRAFARAGLDGWRLRILGDGAQRAELEALAAELGITGRLDLLGHVADPFPHYRAAGLYVLCSRYEGSPNALLEAMGAGCAVVVSDSLPGALEVVRDGVSGRVVPQGEVAVLAAALLQLAEDPDQRQRLGGAARGAVARFRPDRVLGVWDRLLWTNKEPDAP